MARRTVRQRAATTALVARNTARRAGGTIRRTYGRARSVARRGATRIVEISRSPRVRRAGRAALNVATAQGIAQAKILPGLVGGYAIGALEQNQRKAHAKMVADKSGSGALIKDPMYRLLAEAAALAFLASKTSGFVRDAAIGASGGVGALYQLYTIKDGSTPTDDYINVVKSGGEGI